MAAAPESTGRARDNGQGTTDRDGSAAKVVEAASAQVLLSRHPRTALSREQPFGCGMSSARIV
ncbi:MAG: hypothetical protein V2A73_02835 [Pseudomonadota bacterium]